jgi:hypothetical protein
LDFGILFFLTTTLSDTFAMFSFLSHFFPHFFQGLVPPRFFSWFSLEVVEVPVVGDTLPGQQQRSCVDLPVLRREAPPEVRMEVVQGLPGEPGWVVGMVGMVGMGVGKPYKVGPLATIAISW